MKTVQEFIYLDDRVSSGGGCEVAVTATTICGWVMPRLCGELLYGSRFPLRLKWDVYMTYVNPAILHESKAWNMEERWEFYAGQRDTW